MSERSKLLSIIALLAALTASNASAEPTLCEKKLGECYEHCKQSGTHTDVCSATCNTSLCGFVRPESYGTYLERMIEESAGCPPNCKMFVSLKLLRRVKP